MNPLMMARRGLCRRLLYTKIIARTNRRNSISEFPISRSSFSFAVMQENPYSPPSDLSQTLIEERGTRTDTGTDHRFWIALGVCPMTGPILAILSVTVMGLIYQASGMNGSQEANPVSLLFFPIIGLMVMVPANYLLMAITLFPFLIYYKKKERLTRTSVLLCWILSLCVLTVGSFIIFMISSISTQSPDTFTLEKFALGMETGLSIALMFFPSSLIGVITFWLIGVRGRIFETRPLSSTSTKE